MCVRLHEGVDGALGLVRDGLVGAVMAAGLVRFKLDDNDSVFPPVRRAAVNVSRGPALEGRDREAVGEEAARSVLARREWEVGPRRWAACCRHEGW
eukprot:3043167-Rhodomonas_salina.1